MKLNRLLLVCVTLVAWQSATVVFAEVGMAFELFVQGNINAPSYTPEIQPLMVAGNTDLPFSTLLISNADQQIVYDSTTNYQPQQYSSLNDALAEMQQSWTMVLDQGLGTERDYTMSFNLGNLLSVDLTPAHISSPAANSVNNPLTPTFTFTTSSQYFSNASLQNLAEGFIQETTALSPGATTWTPSSALAPNATYVLDIIAQGGVPGLGFSAPLDADEQAIPNWNAFGNFEVEGAVGFSTVPEPSSMVLLAIGGGLAVSISRRRKRA